MLRIYVKDSQVNINANGDITTLLIDLIKMNFAIYEQIFKEEGMPLEAYATIVQKLIIAFPEHFKQTKAEKTINAILDREDLGELQ
jgi:hypothetical protein